ncbi:MAG TPA: ASCH domain-containing protein [Moraxellaceae bacterium]|nr:ASCH domain-containing protein [Moraxellaceae bacterium]
MTDLILPVKRCYFEQMRDGTKAFEYRLRNAYWQKRLMVGALGRHYDRLIITLGYPKADDTERRLVMPYRGFEYQTITHEHFGPQPVEVFAIKVQP